jgi:hypothetical protein
VIGTDGDVVAVVIRFTEAGRCPGCRSGCCGNRSGLVRSIAAGGHRVAARAAMWSRRDPVHQSGKVSRLGWLDRSGLVRVVIDTDGDVVAS